MRLALAALLSLAGVIPAWAQPRTSTPDFDITVVMAPARVTIDAQLTIPPRNREVQAVTLQLDRRCSDPDVDLPGGGTTVTTVRKGSSVTVTFASAIPAGQSIRLRVRYAIGAAQARSFYVAEDGAYFSGESYNWYPIPSDTRRARGRLHFTLPSGFVVASTGRRQPSAAAGNTSDFVIDAPTTFSFAIGRHQIHEEEGSPTIAIHTLRPRPLVRERLDLLRRILSATVAEFGPYPHPDLEVVEMPEGAAGPAGSGTSLEGFVVVSPDVMDAFDTATIAHEVSHQWWADSIFGTGPGSMLIADGMAEYGALRAVETIYGEGAAAGFRWNGYPGITLLGGGRGYLSFVMAGLDAPLTGPATQSVHAFKGALVHDLLSRTVGREAFRTFLHDFTREHAFSDTAWSVFVDAAISRFGDRIRTFVRTWYDQPGVPAFAVTWTQQGAQLRGAITQDGQYDGEIDVVASGDGQRPFRVSLSGPRTEFSAPIPFTVTSVRLDPDYKIPNRNADRMAGAAVVAPFGQAVATMRSGGADFTIAAKEVLTKHTAPSSQQQLLLDTVLAGEALDRGDRASLRRYLDAMLAGSASLPEIRPRTYYELARLAAAEGDRDAMSRFVQEAVRSDLALFAPSGWGLAARELTVSTSR